MGGCMVFSDLGNDGVRFLLCVGQQPLAFGLCFLPHMPDLFQIQFGSILGGLHNTVNFQCCLGNVACCADPQPFIRQFGGKALVLRNQRILLQLKLIDDIDQLSTVQPFEFLVSNVAIPPF